MPGMAHLTAIHRSFSNQIPVSDISFERLVGWNGLEVEVALLTNKKEALPPQRC